jgi:branched-chain amino acid transport system substrate-binding protein
MRARILASLALAAALATTTLAVHAAGVSGDPVEVPIVLSVTGYAAFLGQEQAKAIPLLESYVNQTGGIRGRPLKFKLYDEQSNPTIAVQVVTQALAASKVPVFVGPEIQAACNATAAQFKNGPVAFCIGPSDLPEPDSYRYCANASLDHMVTMTLRYARLHNITRVALVNSTDAAGQAIDKAFTEGFAQPDNKGVTVTGWEHFAPADISIAAQIARIKASNPQLLIAFTTGTPLATILRGYRDGGLSVPVIGAPGTLIYAQMEQYKDILPKDLLFPGIPGPLLTDDPSAVSSRDPVRRMQGIYRAGFKTINVRPDYGPLLTWDAMLLAVEILRHVGPNGTAQEARNYIANLHGFPGILGFYDFRGGKHRGVGIDALAMDRWDPAKDEFVAISKPGGAPL